MTTHHQLAEDILKACDIRGIVDKNLNVTDARFIARAFGTALFKRGKSSCVIGYDGRHSSAGLCDAAAEGLAQSGIDVTIVGLVPTPAVYFALTQLGADAGVIVTASHNPAEYNGFKFFTAEGPFHGADIQALGAACKRGDFVNGHGSRREIDIVSAYIRYVHSFLELPFERPLHTVWDPGNGAVAALLTPFLERLPGKQSVICGEVNGDFPVHHPDPSLKKNMEPLRKAVLEQGADLGIAFDGDGDRLGLVDGTGYVFQGDQLMVLFARELLRRHPGATVMSEVKASSFFYEDVAAHGGNPLMWKVGHTHQKEKMQSDRILLAGETSGHIFFAENRGYDDALFSAVKLLNILAHSKQSAAQIRESFPVMHDSGEIRIPADSRQREHLVAEIMARLRQEGRKFVEIDGIRAECHDGFWMMRGSNTQPHITIRCEARSKDGLHSCLADLRRQLAGAGVDLESAGYYAEA